MTDERGAPPPTRRDQALEAEYEQEGPASGSRIAIFAFAIAVVLGVVFYGLSSGTPYPKFDKEYAGCNAQNDSSTMALQCPWGAVPLAAIAAVLFFRFRGIVLRG